MGAPHVVVAVVDLAVVVAVGSEAGLKCLPAYVPEKVRLPALIDVSRTVDETSSGDVSKLMPSIKVSRSRRRLGFLAQVTQA
jgi:hypothetical protein